MLKFIAIFAALAVLVQGGPSDPEPRPDQWWVDRHEQYKANTANNPNIPIVFFGDSITEGWGGNGASVFNQYYQPKGVANYGIGADFTQHVLWRILNGEVDGLNPKLVVLKIGTNNLGSATNAEIAGGVTTIVQTLRQRLPNTKVLVLGVLPRSGTGQYQSITEINAIVRGLHNGSTVFFLDMFGAFSESWGVVPTEYFYDGLHLTTAGYQKWADTMNPLFDQLIV